MHELSNLWVDEDGKLYALCNYIIYEVIGVFEDEGTSGFYAIKVE